MLIELYITLIVVAVAFTIVSFLQYSVSSVSDVIRFNVFLPYMAAVLFFSLSLASLNVQYQHCETPVDHIDKQADIDEYSYNVSDDLNQTVPGSGSKFGYPFSCTVFEVEQVGSSYLFGGFGVLMLLFAIVNTIELMPTIFGTR